MAAPRTRKQPGDFTGQQGEKLRKEQLAEQKSRESELTMATAVAQERVDNTIVDLSDPEHPVEEDAPPGFEMTDDDTVDVEVEEIIEEENVGSPMVVIRTNADLKTNIGYGNYYEFEAGRRYRVPLHVAQHLDEKGYCWH